MGQLSQSPDNTRMEISVKFIQQRFDETTAVSQKWLFYDNKNLSDSLIK